MIRLPHLALLVALSIALTSAAHAANRPRKSPATEKRPTERVKPAPQANSKAVVWRTPKPPKNPQAADAWVNPKDKSEMVFVPAGEFQTGSPTNEGGENEHPQRKVFVTAFWMDKTEATVAQYRKFCQATNREMPEAPPWGWQESHPIVDVSWEDAAAYAKWAGKRLPTEAEWEKAARGTDARKYPWGKDWEATTQKRGNFADKSTSYSWSDKTADDGFRNTAPVGSFPAGASAYGCLDLVGNVWEWCSDWYQSDYYQSGPSRNPTGPTSGAWRVLRGGSWYSHPWYLRCAVRDFTDPIHRADWIGFRCARDAP